MESFLPIFFAVLSAAVLLGGLLALWQSLRSTFGATEPSMAALTAESATLERQTLLDEKESLLRNIKDLEFEHQVGKLSDADYQRLDGGLRARAREVLRLLDEDLGPFRERAEEMIRKHVDKAVKSTPYREAHEPATHDGTQLCAKCGTSNDIDAKFCKECASPLAKADAEAKEAKADAEAKEAQAVAEAKEAKPVAEAKEAQAETEAEAKAEAAAETGAGAEAAAKSAAETEAATETEADEPEVKS